MSHAHLAPGIVDPLDLLRKWAAHAERFWYPLPDRSDGGRVGHGCYGTGYNAWGVQTNQKYLAAMATLAIRGEGVAGLDRQWALDRALAALRFSLASHVSGGGACTDGTQWGHTWISALGIERMMHGVYLLWPELAEADRNGVRRMLASEAEWLYSHHQRGSATGVFADVWNASGKNAPESNLWNGALLWRSAAMIPDHPHAAAWQERAHQFLINSVSVAADAEDETLVDGKTVRERQVGANFFPNYALDHHGYLNVGYMVICVSNAAMLHFDCKLAGLPRPESLDHHQADLWRLVRRLIFSDGRLARIGGDSRVRYAYCQEYLLPSLLYAADRLGDEHALRLVDAQLALIAQEARHSGDGSFFGKRLAEIAVRSPYYYTRLESDRACALSQLVVYRSSVDVSACHCEERRVPRSNPSSVNREIASAQTAGLATTSGFEASVAGVWHEPEHGAVFHRSPDRLASFAWRAFGLAQGMCQPPDDGHLAEWESNLVGQVEFVADPHPAHPKPPPGRRLIGHHTETFDGGFMTCGTVSEGAEVELAEGWTGRDLALHHIAFVALPDDRTVVGLEIVRLAGARALVRATRGLHLNIPNDLYNGFSRTLTTELGTLALTSPAKEDELVSLGSRWVDVDGRVGVVGIYGAATLAVHRSAQRRGGAYHSLYVDELCWSCRAEPWWADAGTTLLDVGWAVLSGTGAEVTRSLARDARLAALPLAHPDVRGVTVVGADGQRYLVVANFGPAAATMTVPASSAQADRFINILSGETLAAAPEIVAGEVRLFVCEG